MLTNALARIAAAACLVLMAFGSSSSVALESHHAELRSEVIRLHALADNPNIQRLQIELALERFRNSEIGDDLLLLLADVNARLGLVQQAEQILQGLAKQIAETKVDIVLCWDGMTEDESQVASSFLSYYAQCPDSTADHALLALSGLYAMISPEKEWEALERLRVKYPKGDRAEQDAAFLRPMLDWLYKKRGRFGHHSVLMGYRRPHFKGLISQALFCKRNRKSDSSTLFVLRDLVQTYGQLMTLGELETYARWGLKVLDSLDDGEKAESAEARDAFEAALEEVAAERKVLTQ